MPKAGRSVDGNVITLKGATFAHGLGTHADSEMIVDLKGASTEFASAVGVDDEVSGSGSVTFEVWVDGKKVADSGVMRGGQEPKLLKADLTGAKRLVLRVTDAGDGINFDHADWAGAVLFIASGAAGKPQTAGYPRPQCPR